MHNFKNFEELEDIEKENIKLIISKGYKLIGYTQMYFEETYVFETEEDAIKAYNEFEQTTDGDWIGNIVGWWLSLEQYDNNIKEYIGTMGREPFPMLKIEHIETQHTLCEKLRNLTGAGLMLCKKALNNTNNDLDKAQEYIEKYLKSGKVLVNKQSNIDLEDDYKPMGGFAE